MRRALASLLLAVIGFPLIGAPLFVEALPGVPACCRRNGQHHCETAGMGSPNNGPVAASARCASWPGPAISPRERKAPLPAVAVKTSSPLLSQPWFYGTRPRRAHATAKDPSQKRGPPFLLD